jgi:myo-inositol catabolism protein IolH
MLAGIHSATYLGAPVTILALDPYMHRTTPLGDLPALVADLGYEAIELSPREDFLPFFVHPRADKAAVQAFKRALRAANVDLVSLLPLYRWSSPDESERQAAVRYWRRAIEIAVELGCRVMNSEFSGQPEAAGQSEAQFWRSMEELIPILEREAITLHLEPHPGDFVEDGIASINLVRAVNSPSVRYLYCVPHTFHMGGDLVGILRYAGPLLRHVHVADVLDHRASSGNRYIVNPPGAPVRVHQHLDIGQGEINWHLFFSTLAEINFDGIITSCVLSWEEHASESARFMKGQIDGFLNRSGVRPNDRATH